MTTYRCVYCDQTVEAPDRGYIAKAECPGRTWGSHVWSEADTPFSRGRGLPEP